jgi:tetratricopeptide (TPR) repeat protein
MPGSGADPMVELPLGVVLAMAAQFEANGQSADSARLADFVLAHFPHQPDALHLKGLAEAAAGRNAAAAPLIEAAIAHGLDQALYHRNITAIYERLGRLDEAVAAGRRAVALDATDAQSYHNLTIAHMRRLELDESIACARVALALNPALPGAHFALAEALLLRGDFAEGWREYEWRFRIKGAAQPMPATAQPAWDGAPMPHGTLLLVADQGYGDVIQFSRYVLWAAARCPGLIIACDAEMRGFLVQLAPQAHFVSDWAECPPYTAWAVLSGLPFLHGTTLENIPAQSHYLQADAALAAQWRARLDRLAPAAHRRIGLVWAGRPAHSNNHNRSMKLATLLPLFDAPDVTFVSLQKGPAAAEAGACFFRAPLLNLAADIESFADTAAILAALDLVITVDTAVAHLAGALGRPAWVLLPFAPDWRWLLGRSDSPWYPGLRLFRQRAPGEWDMPVKQVRDVLF